MNLPDYVGPCAFGIKMGVVLPGIDLEKMLLEEVKKLNDDNMLADGDVLSVTESILARAQNNYVTTEDIAREIREKLELSSNGKIGVVFPIASRNRFSLILEAVARAVPQGEVIVQLSYPDDEVGNQIISQEKAEEIKARHDGFLKSEDLEQKYVHPLTGVDYIDLYLKIIQEAGPVPQIYLCNDPVKIVEYEPDGIIVSDIHTREKTKKAISAHIRNCCTLQDICNGTDKLPGSEWGLLGSNMSTEGKLKLAPSQADRFACSLQAKIKEETGKQVEILISGDGAYKDPSSGIYELADPKPAFGATPGINNVLREGVKMKYLIDLYHNKGKSKPEIMKLIQEDSAQKKASINSIETEGTTPRRMGDVLASLADLISGSADAGTPVVLIKGIYQKG